MTTEQPRPLQVDAIPSERMVFRVQSESDPRRGYRVDLLSHGGIGECDCKHWLTKIWSIVRDGGEDTCKHVYAARQAFLRDLLRHMAREETEE